MSSALEADLNASESERETLLGFLYAVPLGLARLNARGDVELANAELSRLMQAVRPGGGMGNFFDFADPIDPQMRAMARDFTQSAGLVFQCRHILKPGRSGIEALSCSLTKLDADCFMLVVSDATETVARERELARDNALLEVTQQVAHVGHYRIDIATQTLVLSDELYRICGRAPRAGAIDFAEARGWMHEDDRLKTAVVGPDSLALLEGYWAEHRMVRPDGEIREVLAWRMAERDAAGTVVAILGVFIDVTERKAFEREQVRLRKAAEQANCAKNDFLSVISHELRTPMNGILGMNALLLETLQSAEPRRMAEVVQQSAQAMLVILNDVLEVARLGAGRLELSEMEFELAPLLAAVVELMGAPARAKGLALTLARADGGAFRGDAGRLRQIVVNLVSNAVKFTERGEITVAVTATPERDARARLRFEVSDSGPGVPDHVKLRLFQPFVQADSSTARRFGGSGLGLSISRGLVELMGGAIGVVDRPGGGSIFWFEVALALVQAPVAAPEAASAQLVGAGRVLVAEDNDVSAEIMRLTLGGAGFEVCVAPDGVAALEAARAQAFDLILMDLRMPRLDGLAATRAIRALPGRAGRARIVALTANAMPDDENNCRLAGMDAVLAKPIAPARLRTLAAQWCASAGALAEGASERELTVSGS